MSRILVKNHWDTNAPPFFLPEKVYEELKKVYPALESVICHESTPTLDCVDVQPGVTKGREYSKVVTPEDYYRRQMNKNFTLVYGTGLNPCGEIVLGDPWGRKHGECWIGRKLPEPPKPVRNKREYYERYIAGEFGNRLQVWATYSEWRDSGFSGAIGIRNRKPDSPFCRYDIPCRSVLSVVKEFELQGCALSDMTFNEAAPDSDLTIQGEFCINYDGQLALVYSHVKRQMRIALKQEPKYATGNHARQILKHFADTDSYEWMDWLLGAYPNHTIEFSTYRRNLGSIPRRNTLIWEVRAY